MSDAEAMAAKMSREVETIAFAQLEIYEMQEGFTFDTTARAAIDLGVTAGSSATLQMLQRRGLLPGAEPEPEVRATADPEPWLQQRVNVLRMLREDVRIPGWLWLVWMAATLANFAQDVRGWL